MSAQTGSTWVVGSAGWQSWAAVSLLSPCTLAKRSGAAAKSRPDHNRTYRRVTNMPRSAANRKTDSPQMPIFLKEKTIFWFTDILRDIRAIFKLSV